MLTFLHAYLQTRFDYFNNERGAVAAEYGLLIFLIALAIIAAVRALGVTLDGLFDNVNTELNTP